MKNEVIINILDKASSFLTNEEIQKLKNILYEELYTYQISKKCTDLVPITDTISKLKLFIACKKLDGLSPKTLKNYARTLTLFFNAIQKDYKQIDDMDVRMYLAVKQNNHLKNTTLNNNLSPIKSFYHWLHQQGYITKDPTVIIKTIKVEKKLRNSLTYKEIEMLRDNCKDCRSRALLEIAYASGVRISELQAINIDSINFDDRSLMVVGKGNKERFVCLNEKSIYYLKKYLSIRTDNEKALFVSERKPYHRIGVRAIQSVFNKMGKRAKIQCSVFEHKIRHSFASHCVDNHMPLPILSELMGHESLDTTKIYLTLNRDEIKYNHAQCTRN